MNSTDTPSTISLDEPDELQGRSIEPVPGDERYRFFAVKKKGRCYVYRNICPHAGAPLNWGADRFLTHDNQFLLCSLHGALFSIETGYCFAGPCKGFSLQAVPFEIRDNKIIIKC
ncbi:MAG TPA: Rieske 2Fe-2S domain-containing protein [Gammaproteobacteria bacterium]